MSATFAFKGQVRYHNTMRINYKKFIPRMAIILLLLVGILVVRRLAVPVHPDRSDFPFGLFKVIFFKDHEIPITTNHEKSQLDPELFYFDDNGRMQYDDSSVETSFGIDVSSYQGNIDWNEVKRDGVEYAFIRVGLRGTTEGAIYEDTMFETNYTGARRQQIPVGVYFFSQATSEEEAVEEARFVIEHIKGLDVQLPVVFDWEYVSETARTAGIDSQVLCRCAEAFCSTIEEAGYSSMIYFNLYTSYLIYDMNSLGNHAIWLAQFSSRPTFYYQYDYWQYSCTGHVAGISGEVDLNIRFHYPSN